MPNAATDDYRLRPMGLNRDLLLATAAHQLSALRSGEVSARELLAATVAHAEQVDPGLNLIVARDIETAVAKATAIDNDRANGLVDDAQMPLAGLPITVKDSFMATGMPTTSGAPALADFVPDHDADVVAALKSAGAVIYAKTNLPLYAGDVQTYNELHGTSNNPWDPDYSVGGSSGGSAGALAAGFTALEIGSDIAGSIRNPAAMCGVVGHKPSYGIVSGRGQIPGPPGTLTLGDIAVVGPMARTVDDCRLAFELMVGPNAWESTAWSLRLPPARPSGDNPLRVAVWADDPHCRVDPAISAAVLSAGDALADAGAIVSETARPEGFDFAKADATFNELLGSALSGSWSADDLEQMARTLSSGGTVHGGLGVTGATLRHRTWLSRNERRLQMRNSWRTFFESWDVVLAPVSPTVAIPHDHSQPLSQRTIDVNGDQRSYTDQLMWMGLFGVVYLPSTAVPVGLHPSLGLPIGIQVVGPYLEDHTCLAVAEAIERLVGGFRSPPLATSA